MTAKAKIRPPAEYEDLKQEITDRYDSLSRRLRDIARFALENPSIMALETIANIARTAKVQPSRPDPIRPGARLFRLQSDAAYLPGLCGRAIRELQGAHPLGTGPGRCAGFQHACFAAESVLRGQHRFTAAPGRRDRAASAGSGSAVDPGKRITFISWPSAVPSRWRIT